VVAVLGGKVTVKGDIAVLSEPKSNTAIAPKVTGS
jgi:hypothetical protein